MFLPRANRCATRCAMVSDAARRRECPGADMPDWQFLLRCWYRHHRRCFGFRIRRRLQPLAGAFRLPSVALGACAVARRCRPVVAAAETHRRRSRLYADISRRCDDAERRAARGNGFFPVRGTIDRPERGAFARGIPPAATVVISGYERVVALSVSLLLAGRGALYLFGTLSINLETGGVSLLKLALGIVAVIAAGALFAWGRRLRLRPQATPELLVQLLPQLCHFAGNSGHDAGGLCRARKRAGAAHRHRFAGGGILHRHAGGEPSHQFRWLGIARAECGGRAAGDRPIERVRAGDRVGDRLFVARGGGRPAAFIMVGGRPAPHPRAAKCRTRGARLHRAHRLGAAVDRGDGRVFPGSTFRPPVGRSASISPIRSLSSAQPPRVASHRQGLAGLADFRMSVSGLP